jgi:hypothetical protein
LSAVRRTGVQRDQFGPGAILRGSKAEVAIGAGNHDCPPPQVDSGSVLSQAQRMIPVGSGDGGQEAHAQTPTELKIILEAMQFGFAEQDVAQGIQQLSKTCFLLAGRLFNYLWALDQRLYQPIHISHPSSSSYNISE